MDTQGSDARSNGATWWKNGAAHSLNGSTLSRQLRPPSNEKPATRPLAPPSFQRSCCHAATRFRVARGFSASEGSTSAFGLFTPPKVSAPTPTQAANGSPWDARTCPPPPAAEAGAASANASSAANAPESASRRMHHPPLQCHRDPGSGTNPAAAEREG